MDCVARTWSFHRQGGAPLQLGYGSVLYGALAAWRGNLRVNIISHAWSDFWEGRLKFLIRR